MNIFKNKSFVLILVLALSLFIFSPKVAHADVVFNIAEIGISILNVVINAPLAITEMFWGRITGVSFFSEDGACRLQNVDQTFLTLYQGKCGVNFGTITIPTGQNTCSTIAPTTFYIPSFNIGYVETSIYCYYEYYRDEYDNSYVCSPLPADAQRYSPSYECCDDNNKEYINNNCGIPNPTGSFAMVNSNCAPITSSFEVGPIDETNNQIAFYRFSKPISELTTASGEVDNQALARWYMGIIELGITQHPIGSGIVEWPDQLDYYDNPAGDSPIETGSYSDHCLDSNGNPSNVCTFVDNNVPKNSYIIYAAKILGNYIISYTYLDASGEENSKWVTESPVVSNKFLKNVNSALYAEVPGVGRKSYSLGNVFYGPVKTDTLSCPPSTFDLNVTKTGTGSGTVNVSTGALSWAGNVGTATYNDNTFVNLTAAAFAGSTFSGWSGEGCVGNLYPCGVSMTAARNVTATFSLSLPPGDFNLSSGGSPACNSVPLSWTTASGADGYRILRDAARVDITPYQPYTAQNFTDTTVSQNTSYLYQIEAYNAADDNRSNALNITTPYCAPTVSLLANPTSIYQGQRSTLTWTSTDATSCSASNSWSGSKSLNGGEIVYPAISPTTTYTLTCSGPGGSAAQSATVDVAALILPDWREIIPR